MKREKREEGSNSIDKISELPQDILQRILYWLSQEDAVRTSVLSKSWRNICFDCASVSLVEEWVRILTSMCVKKFCLCNLPKRSIVEELPSVVFGAESLQDLHLAGFVLHREAIERMTMYIVRPLLRRNFVRSKSTPHLLKPSISVKAMFGSTKDRIFFAISSI
ncbi:PREDICTED: F-box/LRR-repeat protein 13-like [Erythranthe guttata]|uniref:F-box/LRR-repeat protein 13-like n=1 Tax=Erythranthe guttata TaxID=4155 RepID=UPI00064DA1A4|nr:PREDICTED: F-box/LRR-repeat protein 13-like [Erythranthe guttata]|eukprot:XP_012844772.1 PREDICTED: F-box/LRR-repeat protein 13-like [Erythranthe guttata]